jgi:hypothetical protein
VVIHSRPFDVLGLAFDVRARDPHLISYVERLFQPFPDGGRTDHQYALVDSGPCELRFDGDRIGEAEVVEGLVATLVHDLNRRALEDCAHLVIHAGGVEHGGTGIVFPAAMEAGKTTLTAGLVRAGFDYLSDEAVIIDRETLRIHRYPKPLSLDRGAWALFPELEPQSDLPSDEYKADQWQVPPGDIRPHALGGECPVSLMVFPRYEQGAGTAVEPLGRGEALVELAKNTFKFDVQGAPTLDVLAEVVRPAACYRLTSGDLDRAVAAVTDLLATLQAEPDNRASIR